MTHSNYINTVPLIVDSVFNNREGNTNTSVNVSTTNFEKQYFIILSQIYTIIPSSRFHFCLAEKAKIFINSHEARWLPTKDAI